MSVSARFVVVCTSKTHRTKKARVTVLQLMPRMGEWFEISERDPRKVVPPAYGDPRQASMTILDGDSPATALNFQEGGNARRRYSFECPLCGDRVSLRQEKLKAVLLQLVQSGVSEISINGLRLAASSI